MSTATKLEYLNETKSLLKDSINSLGGEITSQTTFRQYATELDSIYSRLPKVSGTGTSISLSPTKKGRLGSVINGDTFQQTYTGKNLLNLNNYIKGYFETTGTINYGVPNRNCIFYLKCEPSTKYTFKTQTQNVAQIIIGNTDETPDYGVNISNATTLNLSTLTSRGFTYTTSSTSQYIVIRLQIATGYSYDYTTLNFTDFINNPQVELGPTATSYEPYVGGTASPNPDYPQDIQSATGLQNINVCGKNLFDKDNSAVGYLRNSNGTINPESGNHTSDFIVIIPNTNYIRTTSEGNAYYDENKAFISYYYGKNITTPNNAKYLRITVKDNYLNDEQLEQGSTATEYEPYQSQTKELNLGTIELNKIGDYKDYITGTPNNWVLHKNIGKINIIVNSKITSWGGRHWIGFSKPSDSIMHDAGNFNRYKLYMEKAYYSNTNDAIYSYQTGLAAYAMGVMCNENDDPTTLKNQLDGSLMYYPLKEETTEAITNTELIEDLNNFYNAKSYNGQTNISVDGDLPMILDVSALKGEA